METVAMGHQVQICPAAAAAVSNSSSVHTTWQSFWSAPNPVAVLGSSGFLGIALNGGSAARKFGLKVGDKVIVRVKS